MKTIAYLIRHGNINCADLVPGRMPGTHLSEDGRKQAADLVGFFDNRGLDAIYCSPLDRAVETAAPLARHKSLQIHIDDSFNEINFGEWTGKKFSELENDFRWKQFHFFRNGTVIPSGELMVEVQSRMIGKLQDLKQRHRGQSFAIFSHNDPIKSVIAFYIGISLDLFLRITIDTGSISVLNFENGNTEVSSVNVLRKYRMYKENV
ncbi:MAG TPA: histidine phosphatase family protein [Chitinispirillaceae bacterium]|nr:histidine phosphatase family protein [Chitinispirillaceae bacterium]